MKSTVIGALEWSGEILQEIFRHTPVGVVLTDLHGTVLDVNEALLHMLGYPRDQVIGQSALAFLHPDEEGETSDFLSKVRDDTAGSGRGVKRMRLRSGKTIWANVT